ncbi:MAG: hypothetical protein MUE84_06805 [Hyphomonas sp.]|jgi:hypothetical protein|nr:hypothetical protein [Hyphomonas sp.]
METRVIYGLASAIAVAFTAPSLAQVPPELFGGGEVTQQDLDTKSFYDAPDGAWVQMTPRDAENNGLGCMVSFIAAKPAPKGAEPEPGDSFGIMGPNSAKHAKAGVGMVIFTGPGIPRAAADNTEVRITILSDDPPNTTKAIHINNGEWSMFAVPVHVHQMIDASNPRESIGIQFQGKEVFRVNIVEYNTARTMLRNCMAKYRG